MTKTGNSLCIYSDENPGLCQHFQIFGEPDIIQSWPRREKALVLNGVPVVYFGRTNGGEPIYWTTESDTPAGDASVVGGMVTLIGEYDYKPKGKVEPPENSNALKERTEFEFDMGKSTFSIWMDKWGYLAPSYKDRAQKTLPPTHKSEMYPDRFGSANVLDAERGKLVDYVWLSGSGRSFTRYMGGRITSYDGMNDSTKAVRFSVDLLRKDALVVSAEVYDETETSVHPGGFYATSHIYVTGLSISIEDC